MALTVGPTYDPAAEPSGFIHSVETAGAVDGPGLRYVIFTTGCPLQCLYCHNPDTHYLEDGKKTTVRELINDIVQYKAFLRRTGGGVTVSGGEPLFQQEFVTSLFQGCKEQDLHTALDTSGYLGNHVSDALLSVTDLVLLDIKAFDETLYQKITSIRLKPTLDFAEKLAAINKPMWVRYVLVPDLTDDFPSLTKLADYLKKLGNVERVEILPFHKMGEPKWEALKIPYTLKNTPPPTPDIVEKVHDIFKQRGLIVI